MTYKTIIGGFCPGGRVRMKILAEMMTYEHINPSLMATHIFKGFDKIEEIFLLMKEKPRSN